MSPYFKRILVSIDQLWNTILFGNEDETISSRSAKARNKGKVWGCVLCRLLDLFDKDHCDKSIENDEKDEVE